MKGFLGQVRRAGARHGARARTAPSPDAAGRGVVSCVIDDQPRFHLEALRWFAAAHEVAGVDAADLVVHVVGRRDSEALTILADRGVSVRPIEAFDARSPHCNKIAGALALAEAGVEGTAVLTDADLALARDPRSLGIPPRSVGAKVVDAPNPPMAELQVVFDRAGIPLPAEVPVDFEPPATTVAGNANGGLYLVAGDRLADLAASWSRWARWLLDRVDLLGDHAGFVDQVAMTLALAAGDLEWWPLDRLWNFPTHTPEWIPPQTAPPAGVHYHDRVERTGLISTVGQPEIDAVIDSLNGAITTLWNESFPNATFWEWRYRRDPELGSGVGSRGAPLEDKRRLLARVVDELRPASTFDVGCGDGMATRGLDLGRYTGIDLSAEAVRLAQQGRPDGTYHVGTVAQWPTRAELVVCLDVLIHQPDGAEYVALIETLAASATRVLLISGYEQPPNVSSPMIHFHEPLSVSLARAVPGATVTPLRHEHEITTFLVDIPPPGHGGGRSSPSATSS